MTVKRVGIVGSGIMGSGIAEVAAKAGFEVRLRSRQQSSADKMMAGLEKSLGKQVDKGKLDAAERDAVVGRVRAVTDLGELADGGRWMGQAGPAIAHRDARVDVEHAVARLDARRHRARGRR